MKRFSVYVLSLMLSGTFFIACDDDDSNGKLTFDKNGIEMFVGEETVVKVRGGVAPYKATPADKTIAEATVDGGDITIKGLKEGTTTVKVTDKNGLEATIAVEVKEDPYEDEKGDATMRIKWDTYEKIGEDEGSFLLTKAEDKTVTFSWTNEEEDESLVLTFKDTEDKIGAEGNEEESASGKEEDATSVGKLTVTVDGESTDYDVTSWRLVQAKPADDEEGTPITYWIAFTADDKSGLAVAPLTVETE